MHHRRDKARRHPRNPRHGSHPYGAEESGHWMPPGMRVVEVEPGEKARAVSPGSVAEVPGEPVGVVEYHQDKSRPHHGSRQTQRELPLGPVAHEESYTSGPH